LVNIGFIVEGDCEKILISSPEFRAFLGGMEIDLPVDRIINAVGKNNLYHPHGDFTDIQPKVESWINILEQKGAQIIFILIDLENDAPCITEFKSKVYKRHNDVVVVAKQALEAWYLSDTLAVRNYLQTNIPQIQTPESLTDPFDHLKSLRLLHQNRGIGDKKLLTRAMIQNGFSLLRAAEHPECLSAQYFISKLNSLHS
jgi:hypothetical protein